MNKSTSYSLHALTRDFDFVLNAEEEILELVNRDLLSVFNITNQDEMVFLQMVTQDLKKRVNVFVEKHKNSDLKMYQIKKYFDQLEEGESFFLLIGIQFTPKAITKVDLYLNSLKLGTTYENEIKEFESLLGSVMDKYESYAYNKKSNKIGEPVKSKRVCRFCNKDNSQTTFKNISHAISQSLGNRKLILHDECDVCNYNFGSGKGIENDLIAYLKFYEICLSLKSGKNKVHKLKGKNFELDNNPTTNEIELKYFSEDHSEETNPLKKAYILKYHEYVPQNIYKTLCKYAISVMDKKYLDKFKETIKWINGDLDIINLPKIVFFEEPSCYKDHPYIYVYIQKEKDDNLPYAVVHFQYNIISTLYIIPLFEQGKKDFTLDSDYSNFWDFFKQYRNVSGLEFKRFTSIEKLNLSINLQFNQSDTEKSKDI